MGRNEKMKWHSSLIYLQHLETSLLSIYNRSLEMHRSQGATCGLVWDVGLRFQFRADLRI